MFKRLFQAPTFARTKMLVNFKEPELGLSKLLTRCDEDLGGFSTVHLDEVKEGKLTFGRFHGDLSLDLPADQPDVVRLGYSMFRTKDLVPTLFGFGGSEFYDLSTFNQIALRVRGDHRKYFVNIQADTPYPTDLYQHRLFLKTPGQWETVKVPFANFILTNGGVIQQQQPVDTEHLRSIGIGLVDGQDGPYQLDIEYIEAIAGDLPDEAPSQRLGSTEQITTTMGDAVDADGSPGTPKTKGVPGKRLSVDD